MTRKFDSPWKEALDLFLEAFMRFFFPHIHARIDWERGYESLDTQLQEIVREAELGLTIADKLFRVYLLNGQETCLYIHIEIQAQPDAEFSERMFTYYYRIRDRYQQHVVSIAILADDRPDWRPSGYIEEEFDSGVRFRFLPIKLLDWGERREELTRDPNPIALIVLAHLDSLATHQQPEARLAAKWQLLRGLLERGLVAEQVRQLYRLIDWLLDLPVELQQQLYTNIHTYEKEKGMQFVSHIEQIGIDKGLAKGLEKGERVGLLQGLPLMLELKFGAAGLALVPELEAIPELDRLRALQQLLRTVPNLEEFRQHLHATT